MAFDVSPIRGRVIIEVEESHKTSGTGRIVLIDATSQRGRHLDHLKGITGTVAAVDANDTPDGISVGDRVSVATGWLGDAFDRDGKTYRTVEGEDVALMAGDSRIEYTRA